jgi:hypothetical protein
VTARTTGKSFSDQLVVRNDSGQTVDPWRLSWTFPADQRVTSVTGGSYTQIGADVTVTGDKAAARLTAGKKATLVVKGTGATSTPWLFWLNGNACTSD